MSYSPEHQQELHSQEEKKLGKQISICQQVIETLDTDGWINIIEPLIDRSIIDMVGGKIGDTWISGKLDRAKTEEKREFYIGYKQALIDLIGRIKFHKAQLPILEERIKDIAIERTAKFRVPMSDTKYKPEE